MNYEEEVHDLSLQLLRIMNKMKIYEQKAHDWGTGEILYSSEVNMIKTIAKYPDRNVTELAQMLGITKGAISQSINKLAKRGYLKKFRYEDNKKEVFLKLSEKGQIVFDNCEEHFQKELREFMNVFRGADREKIDFMMKVLNKLENIVDKMIEKI